MTWTDSLEALTAGRRSCPVADDQENEREVEEPLRRVGSLVGLFGIIGVKRIGHLSGERRFSFLPWKEER